MVGICSLAYGLIIINDEKLNIQIGDNSKKIASVRHNRENITNSLINIYSNILENKN